MLDSTEERLVRLAKVSHLYYKEGKNQVEVAEAMGLARPMVSRQLKEAEEFGIVKINVEYPIRSKRLEKIFVDRFGVSEVRIYIVQEEDPQVAKALLGSAASRFFMEEAAGAKRIAISWGSTLYEMVRHIDARISKNTEVVQLIGATGREHNPNDGPVIARDLAERLGAKLYLLHAPLVVESELVANALMKDKVVLETLDKARMADIAFVGIGSLEREKNSLFKAGYISEKDLEIIKSSGAVGDTCARFFDSQGRILDIAINRKVIGLPPEDLERLPRVIGVSLGEEKARGILGALIGKRVKGLITDFRTAERVIELADA